MTAPIIDAPEIARLRFAAGKQTAALVSTADLRYALARVDESCQGCMLIESTKQQGQNLDRLYAMIDGLMAQKRGSPSSAVVDLRARGCWMCPHCADERAKQGIGG